MAEKRAGHVVLLGEANTGKSTLMNSIVATKVSIVTHKAQTTRSRIRGIALRGNSQIVFIDTPGLFVAHSKFDRAMVSAAWRSLHDADIVLLMVQAQNKLNRTAANILERLKHEPPNEAKVALVVNKIDLVRRETLLSTISELSAQFAFDQVFLISASQGDGVSDVANYLADNLPIGDWLYPPEQIAASSMQAMAAEITREKLLLRMHQEIPYQTTVNHENWHIQKDHSVRIDQTILVVSQRHKRMIIGPQGKVIRQIGEAARKDIEVLAECRVHLFLQVKIKPRWADETNQNPDLSLPDARLGID